MVHVHVTTSPSPTYILPVPPTIQASARTEAERGPLVAVLGPAVSISEEAYGDGGYVAGAFV